MSICNPCTKTITLPLCLEAIRLGEITESTPIFIYIKNHSTGRLIRLQSISSINGIVTIDTTDIKFSENQSYEIWVTELESMSIDERIEMSLGGESFSCINANFKAVFDKDAITTAYY